MMFPYKSAPKKSSAPAKKGSAPAGKMCPGCKNPACKRAGKCMKSKG